MQAEGEPDGSVAAVSAVSAAAAAADASQLASARHVVHAARRGRPQLTGPQRTSRENDNFVSDFFQASRLHFIGSWKQRYAELLETLPPAPPTPPPAPTGERVYLHVDMDCFFCAVAIRGRPALAGLPLVVSWSDSSKGNAEIASANYAARAFGVKNGMWVKAAKELCPELLVMPYEFDKYATTAELMYMLVFERTPHVMGVSVDECYADVTGCDADPEVRSLSQPSLSALSLSPLSQPSLSALSLSSLSQHLALFVQMLFSPRVHKLILPISF